MQHAPTNLSQCLLFCGKVSGFKFSCVTFACMHTYRPDHAYVKDHKRTKWSYTMGTFKAHLTPNVDAFLEYKSAFVAQYFTEHPAPSWKLVAHAVYCRCEYGVLEIIHKKYLNSSKCINY